MNFGGSPKAAWLVGPLLVAACSSADFTADPNSGGAGGAGGSDVSAEGGALDTNAGRGGTSAAQAGASAEQAGAGDAEGGTAGADTGTGGSQSQGGNPNGGSATGGNPSGGSATGGSPNGGSPSGGGAGLDPIKAFDDFLGSGADWTVTGDVSTESPALYSGGGGNPNGSIYWIDGGGGAWFFEAPAKYRGDDSAYYGGVLRFDLKVTAITSVYANSDVQLLSDTLTLVYDCTPDPTTTYTTYKVPLKETGWKVSSLSGAAATAAQFKQALTKVTRLRIRGEFNTGDDTGHLDNVYLGF